MKERVPPHSIEAEESVLGSMMIDSSALADGVSLLTCADFYRPANGDIFAALQAQAACNEPCDLITTQEELRGRGTLDDCGGTEYLMACIDRVPTAANLKHYAEIVLEKSLRRRIIAACAEITAAAYEEEGTDPGAMLSERALALTTIHEGSGPRRVSELIPSYWDYLKRRRDKLTSTLFSSGLAIMDNCFGWLGDANLLVMKARRGKGKTHFVIHLARRASLKKRAVVLYSLEMRVNQVIDRLLACFGDVDSRIFRHMTDESWSAASDAIGDLGDPAIFICDDSRSVAQMAAECKRLKLRGADIGLVAVDFAELIVPPPGSRSEEQELKTNARLLGDLATALDCTVLLISQANKEGGERGSEGIGNRCDLLLSLTTEDQGNTGAIRAEKNRFGPAFTAQIRLDKATSRIAEITKDFETSS